MFKRYVILLLAACMLLCLVGASSAAATTPAPGWMVDGFASPTNLPPGGQGEIVIHAYNIGAADSSSGAVLTDVLPVGVTATGTRLYPFGEVECSGTSIVSCTQLTDGFGSGVQPGYEVWISIKVRVAANAPEHGIDHVSVVGGGASAPAEKSIPMTISSTPPSFGFSVFDSWVSNADGTVDQQAGSHPYSFTTVFGVNTAVNTGTGRVLPVGGELRKISVNLPPGLIGNTHVVPECPYRAFIGGINGACPSDTQIGMDYSTTSIFGNFPIHVYNLVPPRGMPAQFGFHLGGDVVYIDVGVRSGGDNGITAHSQVPEQEVLYNATTIWGVPADPSHDYQRQGGECENDCQDPLPLEPLLTLPTSCQGPLTFTAEAHGTWQDEDLTAAPAISVSHDTVGNQVDMTGCEKLAHFEPSVQLAPDTTYADTPAGLSVTVRMPQGGNPEGLANSGLENTTVILPEGVVINPGQATGLTACQPWQEALGTEPDGEVNEQAPSCPGSSKVGTDEITTPILKHPLKGNVYVLGSNPPNLQLMIAASGEGVNIKLVGTVHLNEQTGQLVTTFERTPDVPFSEFTLAFSGGAQAALATPTRCGTYTSEAVLTPWSAPFIEDAFSPSRFAISGGPGGTPCQWPLPFAPTMTAGATTDQAGGFTDFTMLLQRGDGQQRMERLQFKTPEGLLGMIAKVTPCQEPQAAAGDCPEASQIGHTVATAGPGPYPFEVPQYGAPPAPIYLTGPYDGAPFGLTIKVPLIAGPFNLGTEIVRARIDVDPHTSRLTITTNPFPVTVKGIPTDIRAIDAVIDRPEFMFNPTDCNPMSFSGTAYSTEGATAPLESHFQMGSCQALKFQPDFKVSTSGRTSRRNGASLTAKIVYPVGNLGFNQASSQSNIQDVKVDLPKQLPSRLPTLQKACTSRQFDANPAGCPSASKVGHAKAITPVLPVPLEGPAYFVSHGGEAFPNLIVVLQGDNVTVDLVGDTFINEHTNITSSTFKQVPDVPIQSFELSLPEGPYSALAANTNLCTVKGGLHMPTIFTGQNGATIKQNTPITITDCPKTKARVKKVSHRAKGRNKKK